MRQEKDIAEYLVFSTKSSNTKQSILTVNDYLDLLLIHERERERLSRERHAGATYVFSIAYSDCAR